MLPSYNNAPTANVIPANPFGFQQQHNLLTQRPTGPLPGYVAPSINNTGAAPSPWSTTVSGTGGLSPFGAGPVMPESPPTAAPPTALPPPAPTGPSGVMPIQPPPSPVAGGMTPFGPHYLPPAVHPNVPPMVQRAVGRLRGDHQYGSR